MEKKVRSTAEQTLLCRIIPKQPMLPYKLITHTDEKFEDELCYDIPEEKKIEELSKAWPFIPTPKAEDELFDIHADTPIKFKDCLIIRFNDRNMLVSPLYFKAGGMSVDLVMKDSMIEKETNNGVTVITIKPNKD